MGKPSFLSKAAPFTVLNFFQSEFSLSKISRFSTLLNNDSTARLKRCAAQPIIGVPYRVAALMFTEQLSPTRNATLSAAFLYRFKVLFQLCIAKAMEILDLVKVLIQTLIPK